MKREQFDTLIQNLPQIDVVGTERAGFLKFFIDETIDSDVFEIDVLADGYLEMKFKVENGVGTWERVNSPFKFGVFSIKVYLDDSEQELSQQQQSRLNKAIVKLINLEE